MNKCKCGSYAINPHMHGRDNEDLDLCDVCYWRKRANSRSANEQGATNLTDYHNTEANGVYQFIKNEYRE